MKRTTCFAVCFAMGLLAPASEQVSLTVGGQELLAYQAKPLTKPIGGAAFRGSNFLYPLKTPSGFVVTQLQPADHLHHFGVWWPWKYLEVDGRKVLCWELQRGDGLIQARRCERKENALATESVYLDRKVPGGPVELLKEQTEIRVSGLVDSPATGYFVDVQITQACAGDKSVTVVPYRYSGFSFRGTGFWNKANSTFLTSEGRNRENANGQPARWALVQGATEAGGTAGILLMSRPDNRKHPEKLRSWDRQHGGAVFVNFNPVMDEAWRFEPGKSYARHYRLFVFDGELTGAQAEELWKAYSR